MELRMPNITGATEREQLAQIRSYLYQIVPQLQFALSNLNTASSSQVAQQIITKKVESNTSANQQPSFNELKSLIITSADIVDAYYEEITSRMVSEYRALSDFGEYTEHTEKLVNKTAEFTKETYTHFETINGAIDNIEDELDDYRFSKGYIKTGIIVKNLTKDEAAKYPGKKEGDALIGVEVGDETSGEFKKFARFTADRLSFYDNGGFEVAYVSNNKLYIPNAEIQTSLRIGGYVDMVSTDGGVVTKWVGGNA